jgi:hypothetical protein
MMTAIEPEDEDEAMPPPPPDGWAGDLPSWLAHCAATGWGEDFLAWAAKLRASRQDENTPGELRGRQWLETLRAGQKLRGYDLYVHRLVHPPRPRMDELDPQWVEKTLLAGSVMPGAQQKGGTRKKAKDEKERGWTDREVVVTFNGFRSRHPGRSGRGTAVHLTAKQYGIDEHRVNCVLRRAQSRKDSA